MEYKQVQMEKKFKKSTCRHFWLSLMLFSIYSRTATSAQAIVTWHAVYLLWNGKVHTQIYTVVPASLGISKLLYLPDNSLAKKGELKTALVTKNGMVDYDYRLKKKCHLNACYRLVQSKNLNTPSLSFFFICGFLNVFSWRSANPWRVYFSLLVMALLFVLAQHSPVPCSLWGFVNQYKNPSPSSWTGTMHS